MVSKYSVKMQHRDKVVTVALSSDLDSFIESMDDFKYTNATIPAGMEHRADLISNAVYGTPKLDWLILWFNGIKDPFQELNPGDSIRIPSVA